MAKRIALLSILMCVTAFLGFGEIKLYGSFGLEYDNQTLSDVSGKHHVAALAFPVSIGVYFGERVGILAELSMPINNVQCLWLDRVESLSQFEFISAGGWHIGVQGSFHALNRIDLTIGGGIRLLYLDIYSPVIDVHTAEPAIGFELRGGFEFHPVRFFYLFGRVAVGIFPIGDPSWTGVDYRFGYGANAQVGAGLRLGKNWRKPLATRA